MMSQHGQIVLARAGGRLTKCATCQRPMPAEHLAPLGPQIALCSDCWARAGDLRNWMRQPALGNGLPVLDVLNTIISMQSGQLESDLNPIRTLVRLLHERDRLLRGAGVDCVCCYCAELVLEADAGFSSLVMEWGTEQRFVIWRCNDVVACDERLAKRIMVMVAQRMREARDAAGVPVQ